MTDKIESMVGGGETWIDDDPVSRTGMRRIEWQRIKALQPRATMMFKSCEAQKAKFARATYRKAEHAK